LNFPTGIVPIVENSLEISANFHFNHQLLHSGHDVSPNNPFDFPLISHPSSQCNSLNLKTLINFPNFHLTCPQHPHTTKKFSDEFPATAFPITSLQRIKSQFKTEKFAIYSLTDARRNYRSTPAKLGQRQEKFSNI
jgi:hypothetical protein